MMSAQPQAQEQRLCFFCRQQPAQKETRVPMKTVQVGRRVTTTFAIAPTCVQDDGKIYRASLWSTFGTYWAPLTGLLALLGIIAFFAADRDICLAPSIVLGLATAVMLWRGQRATAVLKVYQDQLRAAGWQEDQHSV
jgi:hypothetical protein